jgi:hypothetical protein
MRRLTVDHFVASPLTILKCIASATAFCIPFKTSEIGSLELIGGELI